MQRPIHCSAHNDEKAHGSDDLQQASAKRWNFEPFHHRSQFGRRAGLCRRRILRKFVSLIVSDYEALANSERALDQAKSSAHDT
jgi:hypothetical protein